MRTEKRWLVTISLAIPLSLVIAGCAGSPGDPGATDGGSDGSAYGGALGTAAEESAFAELYQAALDEGQDQVVVYGPTQASAYTEAFMERFPGIEVTFDYVIGADRATRLEAEAASGNFVGDVAMDGGPQIVNMASDGLCATIDPFVEIPDTMISTENQVLLPQIALFGLVVNTDLVDEDDVPRTWEDLTDPKWKGKIAVVSPAVGSAGTFANAALLTPEENAKKWGWPIVEGLHDNVVSVGQDSLAMSSVLDGTYPIAMTALYQRYEETVKGVPDAPIEFVLLDEGNIWSADNTCQLKSSPNPLAAELWLNWILSIEGQTVNSEAGAFPTRPGIASPGGLPAVKDISLIPVLDPMDAITGYTDYFIKVQELYGG